MLPCACLQCRSRALRSTSWLAGSVPQCKHGCVAAFQRVKLADGLKVGGWTLVDDGKLGKDVWRVRDDAGQPAVLKTARGNAQQWQKRFAHEVKVLQDLQSLPGVLKVLGSDVGPNPAWVVVELASALAEHLGDKPDLREVVVAFADLAATLAEAAELGIAHRDIKPQNLFYVRGAAALGDFGLATGHDQPGLTLDGSKVGPANFLAPEALQWTLGTDAFAVDVFSFAKSLWAIAAGMHYPPQGPLLIRLPEVDLSPIGGRPAEDLARLLELATETDPSSRPHMAAVRDELRIWLELHPPGSTTRPSKQGYRTTFDELFSVRALERKGLDEVLDRAVHQLLDGCRGLRKGSSSIQQDAGAWLDPQVEGLAGGDPEWVPERAVTRRLMWPGVPDIRLTATGVLEGEDDVTYDIAWHVRDRETLRWSAAWRDTSRARLRLPNELALRRSMQQRASREAPPRLRQVGGQPDGPAADALRRVAEAADRREEQRQAAAGRASTRERAASEAVRAFDEFWDRLTDFAHSLAPNARPARGQGAWLLGFGDRRLTVQIARPASGTCPAVQLGMVTVETDQGFKSLVANLCANTAPDGAPIWKLLRMQRNDLAPRRAPVSEALSDGVGAVSLHELEQHFEQVKQRIHAPSASMIQEHHLDVENLMVLFSSEVRAIDQQQDDQAGD